jgi:hypothetical protein
MFGGICVTTKPESTWNKSESLSLDDASYPVPEGRSIPGDWCTIPVMLNDQGSMHDLVLATGSIAMK